MERVTVALGVNGSTVIFATPPATTLRSMSDSTMGVGPIIALGVLLIVLSALWLRDRGGIRSGLTERWFAWWDQRQGTPVRRVGWAFAIPAYGAILIGLIYIVNGVRQLFAP